MRSARVEAVGCACECVTGCVCARVLCASACPFIRRYRHVRICSLESSSNNMQCAFHLQHGIEQLDLYIHNLCSECVNRANTMCLDGPHAQQCGRLLQSMAQVPCVTTRCCPRCNAACVSNHGPWFCRTAIPVLLKKFRSCFPSSEPEQVFLGVFLGCSAHPWRCMCACLDKNGHSQLICYVKCVIKRMCSC